MTKTIKILSTISFIAMAIVLTFVGVWALADLDFTVGGDITYTAPEPQINLQQDGNGFYVTMGTYNNAPVVWRLVGMDGNRFTGTTAPTNGIGTFVLETYVAQRKEFDADSSDYATSDIRTYLNGDYKTLLNLANDTTYKAITPRSMTSLYTDIGWNYYRGNSNYAENEVYSITTTNTESDKLWLMSIAEVYSMVGGGEITNGTISDDWSSVMANIDWSSEESADMFWLRSPDATASFRVYYVESDGDFLGRPYGTLMSIRPAFNLEF